MLTIYGSGRDGYCDGHRRRDFLRIGALGMGGMALPGFLRAEQAAGIRHNEKAVIMIYLAGGPPHVDMFDLKEDAPAEYRGGSSAIPTSVPGIRVSEHMPRLAANMDKFALLRAVVGSAGRHGAFQCETGHGMRNQPVGGWPSFGSVLSKVLGDRDPGMPPFVGVSKPRAGGGFLGSAHSAFLPDGDAKPDMVLNNGLSLERVAGRRELLANLDRLRRDVDVGGAMDGVDAFTQRAFEVVTSSTLVKALDLKKEDPAVVARYTRPGNRSVKRYGRTMRDLLTARRLVEAGARCVTVSVGGWDTHKNNSARLAALLPAFDYGLACLVEDLHERGMDKNVSVVVWGEFGRTPKINAKGGRDHWPRVMGALLAGGGMKTGQVIGSTDRLGGEPEDRPVHVAQVFSTLYHNCGIDATKLSFEDQTGRPQFIVKDRMSPIAELV